jgi:aspartate aminotransferase
MDLEFGQDAKELKPSATALINDRVMEKNKNGAGIINFTVGQPDFTLSDKALRIATELIDSAKGANKYSPVAGIPLLRKLIAEKAKKEFASGFFNKNLSEKNVFISAGGAKQAINMLLKLFLNPFERVMIFNPYWVSYPEMVKMAGGIPIVFPLFSTSGPLLGIDFSKMEEMIKRQGVKIIILNSPTNPTGRIWKEWELLNLGRLAINYNCLIISDEVYDHFVSNQSQYNSLSQIFVHNNFIPVNSFSKTYAMMGYRVGWVVAEQEVVRGLTAIQGQLSSGANNFGQMLAAGIMAECDDEIEIMKNEFAARKKIVINTMREMNINFCRPEGAFYLFFQVPPKAGLLSSIVFCEQLEKYGVAMVPGDESGVPGWVRMCYAASQADLTEGLKRLKNFIT